MKKVLAGLMIFFGSVNSWAAGGLDLSLSSASANLAVLLSPLRPGGGAEFSLGYLTNETGDNILNATMLARGVRQTETGQYKIGAGFKLVGGNLVVDETVGALAIGFQASLLLVPSEFNPLDFIVEGFYAPGISSFTDAVEYTEVGARIQIDVIPQARMYLGYRRMTWETNDFGNVTVDRAMHVGLSISF